MLEFIGQDVLVNMIAMLRADIDGAILIANESDDARFYETRCTSEKSRVVPAPGLALQVLHAVETRGIKGVVATVNRDINARHTNVFRPGAGDIASMLIASESCVPVLANIAGRPWMNAADRLGKPPREQAAHVTRVLNAIRSILIAEGKRAPDPEAMLERIVNWNLFDIDWAVVSDFWEEFRLGRESVGSLQHQFSERGELTANLLTCDGSDVIDTLAMATQRFQPRGIKPSQSVDRKSLLSMLHVAFDLREFELDEMFWHMRFWQTENGYMLLRDWRELDPLQVLWDQRYWERDLSSLLRLAKEVQKSIAVFKADLDNFKAVNTALGHAGGDEAIRLYCQILKNTLGGAANVYRRGGDETLAICVGLDAVSARDLAEQFRSTVETRFAQFAAEKAMNQYPTASVGVVVAAPFSTLELIVKSLDEAQQQAKDEGKNRVVVVDLLSRTVAT
jgi:diguanylate cyclase (GGDEF)-like protein